jgi:hypothetical protein
MQPAPRQHEASEELASQRHRPVLAEMFPSPADTGYDAREAAYLRSLLVEPLRQVSRESADVATRAMADAALASHARAGDALVDYAALEDALIRIVTTTPDAAARDIAEDALALYQGR